MKIPGLTYGRSVLIVLLLTVATVGTVNMISRRQVPIRVARTGTHVVIGHVLPGKNVRQSGIRAGDVVRSIDGVKIQYLADAHWMLAETAPHEWVTFELSRHDSVFIASLPASRGTPLGYLLLDRLTGLVFLILGLLVWWNSEGDPTVAAFLRVNLITGSAVLLNDFPSVFYVPLLQNAYASAYLILRALVPAALLDFIYRFTTYGGAMRRRRAVTWIVYCFGAGIGIFTATSSVMARLTSGTEWMYRFDIANRFHYGLWLLLAIILAVTRLIYAERTTRVPWQRKQLRWLVICLIIGAAPYTLLEKLPTMWGWPPLIPPDLAIAMLLVTPIGWAMAVASFRMLRVEWTLSRTFVYVITAGVIIYAVGALIVLGSEISHRDLMAPATLLIALAVVLLMVISRALVDRVRWVVDRIFYGDWFDYRRVVRDLETKLSSSAREKEVVSVLTDEMTSILKVNRSTLLVRAADSMKSSEQEKWYAASSSAGSEVQRPWSELLSFAGATSDEVSFVSAAAPLHQYGYAAVLPLMHAETLRGWLLLGNKTSGAPFGERDRRLLNFLAPVAAMALANLELQKQVLDHERRAVVIDLAGGIAHEIGNALSPMMGQAQLIEYALRQPSGDISRDTLERPLQIIVDMCGRIRRIAQNLTRLSQPVVLQKQPVSLNDVAEDAIQLMSETAGRIKRFRTDASGDAEAPFQLRKEYASGLPNVSADAQQISQVFVNLILNAADAMTPDGHGILTVGTAGSIDPPGVIGYVQDTGPGIPVEAADKIFLPYFTTKPQGKGTGLGLSFARSIIEAHEGSIVARTPAEGGARFEFFLPLRKV